ncbi:methyltransferase domain-containing protein [Paenibacillus sp. FSL W8-0194]|uniref:methyltransferase domain-containing protein n=1 Tax=Paenibacillus sp. FSL W8-0194 TaxID=2921711 RepID=UPI0030DBD262
MAIVQVKSTNPQFSYLIKKNPGSGMMLRSIRQGIAYGWYTDESTYNVYFKDADNEISYKQHQQETFEYLNVSRYHTPLFPLNAIGEFFSAPLKTQDERDAEGYEHTFYIPMIHIELTRYIDFFAKHLPEFTFTTDHLAHKSYSLTVTTQKSLYQLLHVVSVLCLFLSMFGNEYIDISEKVLEKYIRSMHVIDAPFYIRSLFVRNFLSSKERFGRYKAELEKTDRYSIQFAYGGTALQRRNFIGGVLPFDKSILDVGCGEGFYALPFAGKIDGTYYAVDVDEEALYKMTRRAESKQIANIAAFGSIGHFLAEYSGERVDVILTEVIEHMSEGEAGELIRQIGQEVDFGHFVITTPNKDFNRFYGLAGFRHNDHKWEMGREAFRLWLLDVIRDAGLSCEFVDIGDEVDGIRTTQGAILKKKEV